MATQTGSYDFKTAKQAKLSAEATASADATTKANEAKKVATNFLSTDSSGIMVYDGTSGTQTPTSPSSNTRNVFIDSDSVDIRQGTGVLATFGATTRVGKSNSANVSISSKQVSVNTPTMDGAVRLSSTNDGEYGAVGIVTLGGTGQMAPSIRGMYNSDSSTIVVKATSNSNKSCDALLYAAGGDARTAGVHAMASNSSSECYIDAEDNERNLSSILVRPNLIKFYSDSITFEGTPMVWRSNDVTEAFYYAEHATGGTVGLGVTNAGRQGVFSRSNSEWIIEEESSGIHIGTSGTTATYIEGSATVKGSLTVGNHSTPIGWYDGHNNTTSVASGSSFTSVSGSSITLSPGRYVLTASASFAGNTSGYRGIGFYSNSLITEGSTIQATIPSTSWATRVSTSLIRNVEASETISLALVQNSGSALSTQWYIKAIRIV